MVPRFKNHGFIEPGDLVFDVGVRNGKFTQQFLALGARVVCIEPLPDHVERMREKFGDDIVLVEAAVSDRVGEAFLHLSEKLKGNPSLFPHRFVKQLGKSRKIYGDKILVQTITIDALAAEYGVPAFIKLDIEGAEYEALSAMTVPVPALCYEFGCGYISEARRCMTILGKRGYEFNCVEGHGSDFLLPAWASRNDFKFPMPRINEIGKLRWGQVFARLKVQDEGD